MIAVAALLMASLCQPADGTARGRGVVAVAPKAEDAWAERLALLDPSKPEAYFDLAEEVADAAKTVDDHALARRLYVLAFELDRVRTGGAPGPMGAAACVGLASIARREQDKRWLVALAVAVDPRQSQPGWVRLERESADADAAYAAASALGLVRSGEGTQARVLLDDAKVASVLRRYERLLSEQGGTRYSSTVELEAAKWPCRDCLNQRIVKRTPKAGDFKLCPLCNGNPGPRLSDADLLAQWRLESLLLSGIHRSWSAQVATDDGEPLRDPEPEELAPTLGVDASLTRFRDGEWTRGS